MALTATATQGFELAGRVPDHDVLWLPGDPGITFTEGDLVIVTNGVLVLATDSAAAVPQPKTIALPLSRSTASANLSPSSNSPHHS